jgi:hypothetical protein
VAKFCTKLQKVLLKVSTINALHPQEHAAKTCLKPPQKPHFDAQYTPCNRKPFLHNKGGGLLETPRHPNGSQNQRGRLLGVVRDLGLSILELNAEASRLASVYVREGVIPARKLEDAQHIAIAVCNQMDVLLSWNFKHLANLHKQIAVRSVNEREGYYYPLALVNPMEVLGEDD